MDQLFGTELPLAVKFLLAFALVLGLIYATAMIVRRLAGRKLPLSNSGRARQPRLGVLDAFAIDARRRLVLIRRDNVEHLIMIGGPNDVVVESHIVRTPSQAALAPQRGNRPPAEAVRAPVLPPQPQPQPVLPPQPAAIAPQPRLPSPPPGLQPVPAPSPFPPRQPNLAAVPPAPPRDIPPPAAPAAEAPRSKPGFFRATMSRATGVLSPSNDENAAQGEPPMDNPPPERREPAPPRIVPAPVTTAPAPAPAPAGAKPKAEIDPLFADIERQLEEALQRPKGPGAVAEQPVPAPKPAAPPAPPQRRPVERPAPPAPRAPEPAPTTDTAASDKSHLDSLEEEMANLLGRTRPS
ncbi:flagellar biosynthetic protein FliO [Flaviflagellibacter deserti]|uniref:Flagellar biosynthetic protein FliO n=1 Tax=Flaviflagellibacter deserti TaxID=2267266 RepID=A0ABV9Z5I0_9HYPH